MMVHGNPCAQPSCPTPASDESQILSLDADSSNWSWDNSATYMPQTKSDDSTIKLEGNGSMKLTTGALQADGNTVGLWHLDETGGSGAYLKDSSSSANNGTPNGTTVVNGVIGKARNFNGTSDYINIGGLSGGTAIQSIEFWAYPTSTTTYFIDLDGGTHYIWANAGTVTATGFTSPTIYVNGAVSSTIVANQWQHIAVTTGTSFNASNTTIGKHSSSYMSGKLDEIRISNIARTSEAIAEDYRMGANHYLNRTISSTDLSGQQKLSFDVAADRPGTYLALTAGNSAFANYQPDTNTVGLWHLDELSGSGAYIKDASTNSNNGTPSTNFATNATGGTITTSGANTINTFTSSGNFIPPSIGTVSYLVVGGGGGSGFANNTNCTSGGGGGGGMLTGSESVSAGTYPVVVGGGGTAGATASTNGGNGGNSSYNSHVATGGGGGGSTNKVGVSGGSGGGGGNNGTYAGGTGVGGQGYSGGQGGPGVSYGSGGGGGAGGTGPNAINTGAVGGGAGASSSITGSPVTYAAGGGGAWYTPAHTGTAGAANTGNGASGAGSSGVGYSGAAGGSGVVIISYPTNSFISNTSPVQGKIGIARSFNDGYISIPAASGSLNINSNPITLEAWIKPNNVSTSQEIVGRGTAGTNGYGLEINSTGKINVGAHGGSNFDGLTSLSVGQWYHVVGIINGSSSAIYINGQLDQTGTVNVVSSSGNVIIGADSNGTVDYFNGIIDEVRISNTARSAADIRAAYESGLRTHQVTIDFAAQLNSGGLIASSSTLSFIVDATKYGFSQMGSNLYPGDKIIVRENYNGTTYIAQGTVGSVTAGTGAVTVESWDSGSTFPSGGFTVNADVFKWQKEYMDLSGPINSQKNAVNILSLRETNGNEGRSIWLDDLRSIGSYLTTPGGSTITSSTSNRYAQYRVILSSADYNVSPSISSATLNYSTNYPLTPTIAAATALSTSSIQWNFTAGTGSNAGATTGYEVYDTNNTLKATCVGSSITSCTETGLSPNTQYTRKAVAYNATGNSAYSATTSIYTLAAIPIGTASETKTTYVSTTSLSVTPGVGDANPSSTNVAVYLQTGATCTGTGGYYLGAAEVITGAPQFGKHHQRGAHSPLPSPI